MADREPPVLPPTFQADLAAALIGLLDDRCTRVEIYTESTDKPIILNADGVVAFPVELAGLVAPLLLDLGACLPGDEPPAAKRSYVGDPSSL